MQKFFHSVPNQSGWRVVDPHVLLLRQEFWLNTELAVFFRKSTLGPFFRTIQETTGEERQSPFYPYCPPPPLTPPPPSHGKLL